MRADWDVIVIGAGLAGRRRTGSAPPPGPGRLATLHSSSNGPPTGQADLRQPVSTILVLSQATGLSWVAV
jgi:hypothetical protein